MRGAAPAILLALTGCPGTTGKLDAHESGRDSAELSDADGDGAFSDEDCDDADPAVHPGAEDVCNGEDDDCSGVADDGTVYSDADADGYGDPGSARPGRSCPEEGESADPSDCDDSNPSVHPAAAEACGEGDADCDGDVAVCTLEEAARWYIEDNVFGEPQMMGSGSSLRGDIDGDGFSDVLLGGSNEDDSQGWIRLFRGANLEDGVVENTVADWTIYGDYGTAASAMFGESLAGSTFVPDLDGDGLTDIIIGSAYYDNACIVLAAALGSASEVDLSAVTAYTIADASDPYAGGRVVEAAGDVDGDAIPDLLIGAWGRLAVFPGAELMDSVVDVSLGTWIESPSEEAAERFARSPTEAGDLDGDGIDDVLVDCYDCGNGAVYWFSGSSLPQGSVISTGDADFSVEGDYRWFAMYLSGAFDYDGDGRDDWAVGSFGADEEGGIFLWYDTPDLVGGEHRASDASLHILEDNGEGLFGSSIAAGDFDGDGQTDLAIEDASSELALYVLLAGDADRTGTVSVSTASHRYSGDSDTWTWGALRMDGDVDGDGKDDLMYADPWWATEGHSGAWGAAVIIPGE